MSKILEEISAKSPKAIASAEKQLSTLYRDQAKAMEENSKNLDEQGSKLNGMLGAFHAFKERKLVDEDPAIKAIKTFAADAEGGVGRYKAKNAGAPTQSSGDKTTD